MNEPTTRTKAGRCHAAGALALTLCLAGAALASDHPPEPAPPAEPPVSVLEFLGTGLSRLLPVLDLDESRYEAGRSPVEAPGVDLDSEFLDRSERNPWMAGLASLVIPGAGQIYNGLAPHAFTLRGFDLWMYGQGGAHLLLFGVCVVNQFVGLKIEFAGSGGSREIDEQDAVTFLIVHAVNALVASVTAFLEAGAINAAGRDYVARMRMHAFFDPRENAAGVEVALLF